MARSISSFKFALQMLIGLQNTWDGGNKSVSGEQGFAWKPATAFSSGTTAYKADRCWGFENRDLASGDETIDLYDLGSFDLSGAGAGRDLTGNLQTLAEIVALVWAVHPDSVGTLKIGGNGTTAAWNSLFNGDDDAVLGPFGADCAGFIVVPTDPALAVADSSNHLLKMTATGDITYSFAVLGRSA